MTTHVFHHVRGTVKSQEGKVILSVTTNEGNWDLSFDNPDELMNFLLLTIEEMVKVFPNHPASKMWLDPNFK